MATRVLPRSLSILLIAALVVSCGGGGGGDDETSISGQIDLPPADQCANCRNNGVQVVIIGPLYNAPPAAPVASVQTDAAGNFDSGDLTAALENYAGAPDTNGDGRRTLIAVATVNNESNAAIGGVLSVEEGDGSDKTFNVMTQVACVATVFLTAGTAGAGDPGCLVRPSCNDQPEGCIATVDPDTIEQAQIDRIEAAAEFIDGDVRLPGDVPSAACAVIDCTAGGTRAATEECVESAFDA